MYFFKVIFLIPILWLSFSKIDKQEFYLNYFKKLEILCKKNSSSYFPKSVVNSYYIHSNQKNGNQTKSLKFYSESLSIFLHSLLLFSAPLVLNKTIKQNKYHLLIFLNRLKGSIWFNAPPVY